MGRKELQTIFISLIPYFGTKLSLSAVKIIDRLYHLILSKIGARFQSYTISHSNKRGIVVDTTFLVLHSSVQNDL